MSASRILRGVERRVWALQCAWNNLKKLCTNLCGVVVLLCCNNELPKHERGRKKSGSMRGWEEQWEMGASKSPPSFGTLTKSRQASARAIFQVGRRIKKIKNHKYNGTKRCVRTHVWWDGVSQVPRACTVVSGSLTKLFKRDEEEKWHIDT